MAIERQDFFEIMASFPSGVAIVTTVGDDGVPRGLTTTAVSSVSAHPPTLMVCVDLGARTLAALRASRRFVVNFMLAGRSDLCLQFASKAEDKFEGVAWQRSPGGLPVLLDDVIAWAECTTVHDLEVGDHVMLVAQVEAGGVQEPFDAPLMYYRRSWGVWTPAHDETDEPERVTMEVSGRDLRWQGAEF
jgi:flavin reductase (DIM6/NTAB) family NADH-FMN oxidoreductase RutF